MSVPETEISSELTSITKDDFIPTSHGTKPGIKLSVLIVKPLVSCSCYSGIALQSFDWLSIGLQWDARSLPVPRKSRLTASYYWDPQVEQTATAPRSPRHFRLKATSTGSYEAFAVDFQSPHSSVTSCPQRLNLTSYCLLSGLWGPNVKKGILNITIFGTWWPPR